MVLRKITGLFVCALIIGSASFAAAGIPSADDSIATMPNAGGSDLALFNLPDGTGNAFADAQVFNDGAAADATINLTVNDGNGDPVASFPSEDMWLVSAGGGMVPCIGGSAADQSTDVNGYTFWAAPMNAGGSDTGDCSVMINGEEVIAFGLKFNSADLNGDGFVNLIDAGLFSGILFGAYDFAADYYADEVMNLADVGRMAAGIGTSCP